MQDRQSNMIAEKREAVKGFCLGKAKGALAKQKAHGCRSVKHRLHINTGEKVKGRVEICEANTTRP